MSLSDKDLPKSWRGYPAHYKLQELGNSWITENKSLTLKVPSCVVNGEYNILINPNHRSFKQVKISSIEAYDFDERLLRKK